MATEKYGLVFDRKISPLELELFAFRENLTTEDGGLGRFEHFKRATALIWPDLQWNPWLERQIESLCQHQWVSWAGCAASGKTFGSTLYALLWWMAKPTHSAVILSSTTAKMIRKRAWANLQTLYHQAHLKVPGNLVDSKTTLQSRKGDDRNALFGIAVLDGATSKAVANIQGVHTERVLAIIDEATDTPEAAFEAAANLSKGCSEFQMLAIGNPHSRLDEHGRFSEPIDGWDSVGVETQQWNTQRGVCVRFDGDHSPNLSYEETEFPYLITREQVEASREIDGDTSPKYWKYTRGWWSPEGVVRTVLSESMCLKYEVGGEHRFRTKAIPIAGLDPAFGGDRCILRFARYGDLDDGKMGIQFDEIINIQTDASSAEPIHFQIAQAVRDHCLSKGVEPEHLAVDASGEGGGLCDIMAKEWDNSIKRIEFGGKPSSLAVSLEDRRPSHDVYQNRVTELWFSVREWVIRGQIKGLDRDTIIEFCQRLFEDEKRKICVEKKSEMKGRTNKSPDLADAAALIIELGRRLGAGNLTASGKKDKNWDTLTVKYNRIYEDENLYAA